MIRTLALALLGGAGLIAIFASGYAPLSALGFAPLSDDDAFANAGGGFLSGDDSGANAMTATVPLTGLAATSPGAGGDQDTLARTIWGEARGESTAGKIAVGCVVRNRVNSGGYGSNTYGSGYVGVCLQTNQFDCWNAGDPNYSKVLAVTTDDPVFVQCQAIAAGIIAGTTPDNTGGATRYVATYYLTHKQSNGQTVAANWAAQGFTETAVIGNQTFFAP